MTTAFQQNQTSLSYYTEHITRREIEILDLMAQGSMNKEIASRLNISPETVKKHIKNIFQKTGANNRIDALNKTRWLAPSALNNQY